MSGNIILTGFSGTGKSSVGRAVAELQGWELWDTDEEIVRVSGKSIADIFEEDGEPAFRYLEKEAVLLACEESNVVVATGGGAIVDPDNYAAMAASGVIVCLDATPETIVARLSASPEGENAPEERPMLAGTDPIERVRELKSQRQEHYDMAAFTVDTDGLSVEEAAREVVRQFRERTEPDHD
ncbi:MAG: shikimate kinase [Chloroflexota bacterium]|nr:shikimate kinase [Chloroflexota bacterium]MDE2942514.1 shikimate kinase [Chloroflexota bacterium]MDE3266886.1 shikimate kinase [Chloroflexota bacterium]